jgi:thiamine-monophosphate kinase
MNLKEIGEFGLIDRIKKIVETPSKDLILGIDDDTAAFRISNDQILLLSTDVLIEGVHFDLNYFSFYQLGWRGMAANLSDIAAMGGWPLYAIVSLGLPQNLTVDSVEEMYRGMRSLADEFRTSIIGGDTTHTPDGLLISMAVVGQVMESQLVRRSGAQAGDALFVTGTLGDSEAGLKVLKSQNQSFREKFARTVEQHLTPRPRIHEARFLVDNFDIHAMIDISDGLASEVHHICKNSGVGAIVLEEQIPLDRQTRKIADFSKDDPVEYALYGGEDSELLFTAPEKIGHRLQREFSEQFEISCTKVGRIVSKAEGISLRKSNGETIPLFFKGYDHFQR